MKILILLSLLALPAFAQPNDLVRDPDGFYTFERSPVSGGWLATVAAQDANHQFSASYETGELYDLFKSLGAAGVNKLRCEEASGMWLRGFFVAHIYSIENCRF